MDESIPGPSTPNDEEVFRRKLLMDGEGMGDAKKIDNLLRSFFDWSEANGQSPEDVTAGYEKLVSLVGQLEYVSLKSAESQCANTRQIEEYNQGYSEMESKIEEVKKVIAEKKEELAMAKVYCQNRLKCDALARIVSQQPDRKESQANLEKIQREIDALGSKNEYLRKKLEDREKQLGALLTSAQELKNKLREELEEWEDSESD